jgi:hypothetical protein
MDKIEHTSFKQTQEEPCRQDITIVPRKTLHCHGKTKEEHTSRNYMGSLIS